MRSTLRYVQRQLMHTIPWLESVAKDANSERARSALQKVEGALAEVEILLTEILD